MIKFEEGKKYFGRFVTSSDTLVEITVVKVTEKTVTFDYNGETIRRKININSYDDVQFIKLDSYSMAPIIKASNEVKEEVEEVAAEKEEENNSEISNAVEDLREKIKWAYGKEVRKYSLKTGKSFDKLIDSIVIKAIEDIDINGILF